MDWADPVPESIVQRVLDQVNKEQRGIILFHDIHDRAVKALPQILDRLIADGYQFAGWNGRDFTVARARKGDAGAATVTTGYEKVLGDRGRHRQLCQVAKAGIRQP
uniref:NodB homology domain-containing protein n=1 Tax=Panagrolaimus superbus TaxID=310955 RepID=A0A914Z8W7_9BILA